MTGEDYEASKDEHDPAHPQYHLPECWHNEERRAYVCICDRLRACEQRVRAFYEAEIEKQGLQWTESCKQFYRSGSDDGKALGYVAGLDAARDAVANTRFYTLDDAERALAAIDALRGESND